MTDAPDSADARRRRADATVDRALELLVAHDMEGFAALWAPTGSLEFPFAAPGTPARLEGRAAVAEYLAGYTSLVDVRGVVAQTRHRTLDPDTVVVEFEVEGVAVATGNPYRMRYVAVVTVAPDGIASYRDYWSPQAAADALGTGTLPGRPPAVTGAAR